MHLTVVDVLRALDQIQRGVPERLPPGGVPTRFCCCCCLQGAAGVKPLGLQSKKGLTGQAVDQRDPVAPAWKSQRAQGQQWVCQHQRAL